MSRRLRKLRRWLAIAGLVGGVVGVWYALAPARPRGASGRTAASPRSRDTRPAIEPIQFHLIPRTQPTPMSPSFHPDRSSK
jgi:hypothetical protein